MAADPQNDPRPGDEETILLRKILARLALFGLGGGGGVSQAYVDIQDAATLASANAHSDAGNFSNSRVLDSQTSAAGIGNGADTTQDTLFTYSIPANILSANGKTIRVSTSGRFGATGNSKRVQWTIAGNVILDSGSVPSSGTDWVADVEFIRIDATHVSVRGIFSRGISPIVVNTPNLVVADLTINTTSVSVTGASFVTGAANDVLAFSMRTQLL